MREGKLADAILLYEAALSEKKTNDLQLIEKTVRKNLELAKAKLTRLSKATSSPQPTQNNRDNSGAKKTIPPCPPGCPLKIAVVLHITTTEHLNKILFRLKNIKNKYDLIITSTKANQAPIQNFLWRNQLTASFVEAEFTQNDSLAFLNCASKIVTDGYDLICKIHNNASNFLNDDQTDTLNETFAKACLDPLLGSEQTVTAILSAFSSQKEVSLIGAADHYSSAIKSSVGLEKYLSHTIKKLSETRDTRKDWGFFWGNMFWMRVECLAPLLDKQQKLLSFGHPLLKCNDHVPDTLSRAFGLLPELTLTETALIYTLDAHEPGIKIVNAKKSRIPTGTPYSIKTRLCSQKKINENLLLLEKTTAFDKEFYLRTYDVAEEANTETGLLYHYLRYGSFERCNPNDCFSSAWYLDHHNDVLEAGENPLAYHIAKGSSRKMTTFPAEENIELIASKISEAGIFDTQHYLNENPDVRNSKINPLHHYCRYGWREGRNPSKTVEFDATWYENNYLRTWLAPINPLLHHAISNLAPRSMPAAVNINSGHMLENRTKPRRICLFAGYDPHGLMDDYVIQFITELSKYSDVYYLADGEIRSGELAKLNDITKQSWAFRHGEYDFGSYSRLARDLVGWDTIRDYDELLLINDSSYLLGSLNTVFKKMESKPCDWWGLQATKGIYATKDKPTNQFKEKIHLDFVIDNILGEYENEENYDFLIGSYFLAFRKPVLEENGTLQTILDGVRRKRSKKDIITHYEIGLTRSLLLAGHRPATFIDYLYPFHPIYTEHHFDLVREGFPLFKRYYLTENHYRTPQLWRWKDKLKEILPNVDLTSAENNLNRVGDAEKLYKTLNIPLTDVNWPRPLLDSKSFIAADNDRNPDPYCWAFPVCGYDESFSGNERLLFEAVKDNPKIRKIILTRKKCISAQGINVEILPLKSYAGQQALLDAGYIFIKHTPTRNAIFPLNPNKHKFINLWHGIPLKRIGYASLDQSNRLEAIASEHARCHAVIASSEIDRLAMAASFYPLTFHNVWVTGLPRNDVILRKETLLPDDYQKQLNKLREKLSGRRLVLFAPTFRNAQEHAYYAFNEKEKSSLYEILNRFGAVLGIREHMADKAHSYSGSLMEANAPIISLDRSEFPEIELMYRLADVLITDYSSCFIDFMLTGKPEICFAYDYDHYTKTERGLFYNLPNVFPGPICLDALSLFKSLEETLSGKKIESTVMYLAKRSIFFSFIDDNNTARLIENITSDMAKL